MAGLTKVFGALAAGLLLVCSTTGIAAPPAVHQVNPWAALAALSAGAAAATICGGAAAAAAAAAAQAGTGCVLPVMDAAPPAPPPTPAPVPPIAAASPGFGVNPLALGLLALAAGIGLYFAVRDSGNKGNTPT